jgi:hypothetical protein
MTLISCYRTTEIKVITPCVIELQNSRSLHPVLKNYRIQGHYTLCYRTTEIKEFYNKGCNDLAFCSSITQGVMTVISVVL